MSESGHLGDINHVPEPGHGPISEGAANATEIIARFEEWMADHYMATAEAEVRRRGVNVAIFSGDDAINAALTKLWRDLETGVAGPIHSVEDLVRAFRTRMHESILDEWRRQGAKKRGGGHQAISLSPLMDELLGLVDDRMPLPYELVAAEEELERKLALLARGDELLREILALLAQGLSRPEIAAKLGISLATVERRIRDIGSSWGPNLDRDA